MPNPHVLMLGWEFPPLINGGLGVACHGIATALAGKTPLTLALPQHTPGHQITELPLPENHLCAPLSLPIPNDLTPYLDASPSTSPNLYGPDLPAKVLDFTRRSATAASSTDFDLIHAHDWMTALAGLEIRARTGKPLIFHVHSLTYDRAGLDQKNWIYELEKAALHQADLIVTVSHYTRDICLTHYQASPQKTIVIHNGIAPISPFRSPKPFPEKLVIFLGRITAQKGPDHFLEIAGKVLQQNPNVRFALAGTGEQLHRMIAKSIRLGIRKNFHFTGFLNRKKVHHLFSMADAYCMPSNSEPFGLSALEATQFGLPSVISKQSGVAEILPHAKTADASDTTQFARHLLDILHEDLPIKPRQVRTWDQAAQELLPHYQRLLT